MTDSRNDLYFSDYGEGKVVGTHTYVSSSNGLKNKDAKEIIIPEFFEGKKIIEIGYDSFRDTSIESIFISRYVKAILFGAFYGCHELKYITFDANSELETLGVALIYYPKLESINLPASLKTVETGNSHAFYYASSLNCTSYFGSNDISFNLLFHSSTIFSSFVAHSLPNYQYIIGTYEPVKDGVKCPEKEFEIQLKKKRKGRTCKIKGCTKSSLFLFAFIILVNS